MGWSVVKEAVLRQKDKIIQFWNRLSGKQRIFFCTGVAVIAVVALLLTIFAGRPKFVPLYTNLDPQDAASITEYLKEKKILYKLENGGATILVPEAQKDELRLSLANEGIPKGGSVGFESFNQTRFGETESERRVRYLVALQGELERTISKLDPVEDVRVHIVIPEPSLFLENEAEATAAVLVKLKPGSSLKEEQVYGIMHLVASGVEGLKSENVTVVDTKGNILSGGSPSEAVQSARMTTDQMEIEREYEKNLERSLKGMLEQIVGQGKAVVRANATLDFDRVEIR
ncbi:MAG: Flagellar M-ring protein, partial [Thermacetogenium phaeum]